MSTTERQQYKIAGPATWELIRAAYLGGESATTLAERFGVSVHAIRKRITVEKWSKRDYAMALEARGIVREKQKPNFIEEGVLREEMRAAAELRDAAALETEMGAMVDRIATEEDAGEIAATIERRALAQASAAMVQGRSKEAQALASMAEMMRKRGQAAASTPLVVQREMEMAADSPATGLDAEQRETVLMELFSRIAQIASHMVHQPGSAPMAFLRMVKRWRELNLGEGEEDAERRAAIIAKAQQHHLEGAPDESWPEDVRAYLRARWNETRGRLERGEPVGVVKKEDAWR